MRGLACGFLVCASVAFAAPSARLFRSSAYLITAVDPPTGWELAASPPSSRLLATWTHRDGGRITLVAEASAETDAGKLFERAKPAVENQGWVIKHVDRQPTRVTVEATVDRGRRIGRQVYAVEKGFSYVLTVVAPAGQTAERARDFEDTVASMRIGPDAR